MSDWGIELLNSFDFSLKLNSEDIKEAFKTFINSYLINWGIDETKTGRRKARKIYNILLKDKEEIKERLIINYINKYNIKNIDPKKLALKSDVLGALKNYIESAKNYKVI